MNTSLAHLRVNDRRNEKLGPVHGYRGVHAFKRTVAICQAEKDSVKTEYKNALCVFPSQRSRAHAIRRAAPRVYTCTGCGRKRARGPRVN